MMWRGVHSSVGTEMAGDAGSELANRIVIVSDARDGVPHEPWVMTGSRDAEARYGSGRIVDMVKGGFIPLGAVVVKHDPIIDGTERLMETLHGLEASWFYFDGIEPDIEFLDELSEFIEGKQMRGSWVQVVLEAEVPTGRAGRDRLLDLASQMSVYTEDGMVEGGRQMSLVLRQYAMAGIDFIVGMAATFAGERLHQLPMRGKVDLELAEDLLRCYADAGIVGFEKGETATVHAAVNLVQGGSPYRQLSVTRVLQWYLSEWTVALQDIPGESIELGLYETQRVTEQLISEYRQAGHFADARYGISFSEYTGEITCDFEMVPYFGVEGVTATGVARVKKG